MKNSKVKVLEASEGMTLERVPGLEDVEAGDGIDEKNTLRPSHLVRSRKAGEEAQIIADKLSEIDSANKETYQKNAKNFIAKAQELTKKYQPIFEKSESKTFVTQQQPPFSYLAKRFGLKQLGIAGFP